MVCTVLFSVALFCFLRFFFSFFYLFRRLQGIEDKAEEGAEILEYFEFVPEDESQMDRHQLVKCGKPLYHQEDFPELHAVYSHCYRACTVTCLAGTAP